MNDGAAQDALVVCGDCCSFTLVPESRELGTCALNAWQETWAPGGGRGLSPFRSIPRYCLKFVRKGASPKP